VGPRWRSPSSWWWRPESSSRGGGSTRLAAGRASAVTAHGAKPASAHLVKPVYLTVEASGDLLIHSPIWERALELGGGSHYNFTPLFAQIKPYITGVDLALCHVETPMTYAPPTGYPIFNTPPTLATAIHATR
jgi:hypothetical protein